MNYKQQQINSILQDITACKTGENTAKIKVVSLNNETKFININGEQLKKLIDIFETPKPDYHNRLFFLTKDQLIVAPLFAAKEYRLRPGYFKEITEKEGREIIDSGAKLIGRNYSSLDVGGFVSLEERLEFYSLPEHSQHNSN